MLENLTKLIAHFFGIIAGSLSGIGAILMAMGYLAERSHLKMLGFTNIPVDLNQYLYTGANLIAFLPGIIILQSISLLFEPLTLTVLFIILLARLSLRIHSVKTSWNKISIRSERFIATFRNFLLITFVFIQMLSLNWMVKAVLVDNLLFSEINASISEDFNFIATNTENLKQLILTRSEKLPLYFTQLFLITLFIGLAIQYVVSVKKEKQIVLTFQMKFWFTINFLLFATHVILIPCNYGVLLLNNTYQEVKVQFNTMEQKEVLHEVFDDSGNENHLPVAVQIIRDQKLEKFGSPFMYPLEASPRVFTDPDGQKLNYSATSGNPEIAKAGIDKNILMVSPLQTGETQITVKAEDNKGEKDSVRFTVHVEEEIDTWGAEVTDSIPPATLVAGDRPFIRDLTAGPEVFRLLDPEPVQLSFRATSGSPEIAAVNMNDNILEVHPVSRGKTKITVLANDGYGRQFVCAFDFTVLDKNLSWPEDNRLLLIYQSNDIFYLYSTLEKRIWYVRSDDIESMVYYGLTTIFK